jgi:polysaccharide pyruvyl transferase WcaK-like protein
MNILVDGYLDRNFGDDMMIRIIAHQMSDCKLFFRENRKELLLPFISDNNIYSLNDHQNVKIDLILRITGSGFTITNKLYTYYAVLNILSKIRLKRKGLPMAIIGCSIGPFVNGFAEWISKIEMRQYDLFTVRDSFSYSFISKYLNKKPVFCYPDILFSMPESWLPSNTGENCLGISAYRMQNTGNLDYYEKIAEVANIYIARNNKKVILFAFDIENENDLAAAFTIKSLCKEQNMVEIIPHNDNGSNIINNMARCSHFISIRLHSLIMALKMGIPFTPVIYSEKVDYILNDLNYKKPRFYIDNFTVDDIIKSQQEAEAFIVDSTVLKNAEKHSDAIIDKYVKVKE